MKRFKQGDSVIIYRNRDFPGLKVGTKFIITNVELRNPLEESLAFGKAGSWSFYNLRLVKTTRKERVMKRKNKIYSIRANKVENGWNLSVDYQIGPTQTYIAKDLGKFITKLTK